MTAISETGADRRRGSRHIWFLNGGFDRIGMDTAFQRVTERPADKSFEFVVTPNVDHLVRIARGNPREAVLYAQAWLTVCDSRILELIAKISGEKVDVTPGSDLTERLFADAIDPDEPVVVIGGTQSVIEAIEKRYGLTDLRWHDAPMGLKKNPLALQDCAEFVFRNPSRFVFLCVGSPQQEMVAQAIRDRRDCTGIGFCVGASLDFLAGKVSRAPRWMQKARLEWLHRLASEPKRMWRRYLVEGPKVLLLWLEWRRNRRQLDRLARDLNQSFASF